MDSFKNNREKSINDIISVVKLVSLFLCSIIIYSQIFVKDRIIFNEKNGYISTISLGMLAFAIMLTYFLWSFFSLRSMKCKNRLYMRALENFVFISILSIMIIKSNSSIVQYKFLFLFIIITSALESGMKWGMTIACIASIIILAIDLIYAPSSAYINECFENDLILVGVFILTAWPLGHYVKIEKENLKQKNLELQKLNKKLNKQDTQRKYMEEIILKNEACYNLLIENSRDTILVHRDNKLIFANEGAVKLIGVSNAEDLNGKSMLDFIPIEGRDIVNEKFKKVYNEKNTMSFFEGKILKTDGEIVSVHNTSTYFIYEGKPTILSILRDITPEKQVEKLQKDVKKNIELLNETIESNKFITEFFSNISHELKTPLNVIFAAVQVLDMYNKNMEGEYVEKEEKYLKVMKQNCYRLMRLINNLLDITRADSGFLRVDLQNHDIISVVEDITLSVAAYVEDKGINLIFDTEVEEKIMAFDPYKIERILLNLLSNAIKFTNPGGEIRINIEDKKEIVAISVRDTGVGIPEDKLKIIFERFRQVDKTLSRNREGSGIGLSLVKSFVEMHGGKVYVESKLGIGSKFIIELPVKVLDGETDEKNFVHETNPERVNIEFSDIYK
ncbi:PAS domain S-box protein [Clostridiaceae bacterium UIB06]|uniref:histidine kinase n=1 Tax=Clostridium thailandense TaxID=2794346 RepID=A0A949WV32_9CLOT|nr:PAS domain-containing sensor histidine kinase [Clostridium thailandense]MBV7273232.1 PAS domain S-box protein [Clostridium thailandense]MCH5136089.1 PAS domain S-box protein [Clostridiaceae bacterium UIB06]